MSVLVSASQTSRRDCSPAFHAAPGCKLTVAALCSDAVHKLLQHRQHASQVLIYLSFMDDAAETDSHSVLEADLHLPLALTIGIQQNSSLSLQLTQNCVAAEPVLLLDVNQSAFGTVVSAKLPAELLQQDLHINLHLFERWEHSPFLHLPAELILACLTSLCHPPPDDMNNLHEQLPQYKSNLRNINTFRLVCREFARIGTTALFRQIGGLMEYRNGPLWDEEYHLNVVKFIRRYGEGLLPWIKMIRLREQFFKSVHQAWKLGITICDSAFNLRFVSWDIRPPQDVPTRQRIMNVFGRMEKLDSLKIRGLAAHGASRWRFEDLTLLFEQGRQLNLSELILCGHDLLDFVDHRLPVQFTTNLNSFELVDCKVPHDFWSWAARYLCPKLEYVALDGFWPSPSYDSKAFGDFISDAGQVLHDIRITHQILSKDVIDQFSSATFPCPLDDAIKTCLNLTWLFIDAGTEGSNLVSSSFLDSLFCPHLRLVHILYCNHSVEQVLRWCDRQVEAGVKKVMVVWAELWGDPELEERLLPILRRIEPDIIPELAPTGAETWIFKVKSYRLFWAVSGHTNEFEHW
ncbi:hypothetical protein BT69DRAFT_1287863 [Atractiella rhizophila]|nr:hypothetical protein BT69DRAFT_1287863 [Atractiella rhizophila]